MVYPLSSINICQLVLTLSWEWHKCSEYTGMSGTDSIQYYWAYPEFERTRKMQEKLHHVGNNPNVSYLVHCIKTHNHRVLSLPAFCRTLSAIFFLLFVTALFCLSYLLLLFVFPWQKWSCSGIWRNLFCSSNNDWQGGMKTQWQKQFEKLLRLTFSSFSNHFIQIILHIH